MQGLVNSLASTCWEQKINQLSPKLCNVQDVQDYVQA